MGKGLEPTHHKRGSIALNNYPSDAGAKAGTSARLSLKGLCMKRTAQQYGSVLGKRDPAKAPVGLLNLNDFLHTAGSQVSTAKSRDIGRCAAAHGP